MFDFLCCWIKWLTCCLLAGFLVCWSRVVCREEVDDELVSRLEVMGRDRCFSLGCRLDSELSIVLGELTSLTVVSLLKFSIFTTRNLEHSWLIFWLASASEYITMRFPNMFSMLKLSDDDESLLVDSLFFESIMKSNMRLNLCGMSELSGFSWTSL